jgi:hypothetical protein
VESKQDKDKKSAERGQYKSKTEKQTNKKQKDFHRLAGDSKNSPQQVRQCRQPQSLLSSTHVLGGWP